MTAKPFKLIPVLLCLIHLFHPTYAQPDTLEIEGDDTPYSEIMDHALEHLDKSRIPYSILYDRVYPVAYLKDTLAGDTINTEFFIQAYSELQRADYNFTPDDDTFDYRLARDFFYSENRNNRIPIVTLNMLYASIDSAAFDDDRIDTLDGQMYDGSNTASPYLEHNLIVSALGLAMPIDSGVSYELQFPDYCQFTNNTTDAVTSISIYNAATSQTWNLNVNDVLAVSFDVPGINILDITLTVDGLSSTTTLSYKQIVAVTSANKRTSGACETDIIPITAHIGFQGYDDSYVSYGKAEYKIYYNYQTCEINNPIIILDGFDPFDVRSIQTIYDENLSYDNGSRNLGNDLRALGYDIVILNFPLYMIDTRYAQFGLLVNALIGNYRKGGADYIERNAMVLIELIDSMNIKLDQAGLFNSRELVIIGPSMGGQISRYALKYMEDNSWNHNTRLWVSFDSPHWGANIPLGFQEMIRYFYKNKGDQSAGVTYNGQLRSPAARQMLIHQTDPSGPDNTYWFYLSLTNREPFRETWRTTLDNLGYPQNLRKVAIANGKGDGGYYHSPGTSMFLLKGKSNKSNVTLAMSTPSFMKESMSEIFNYWEFRSGFLRKLSTYTNLAYGALDGCPGGMYDVQQEFANQVNGSGFNPRYPFGFGTLNVENMTHNISFIPTVSSLALNNPNFNWNNGLDIQDILCNNKTPFDNIYVPDVNLSHVEITEDIANFTIQEIVRQHLNPACPPVCARAIDGDNHIIYNQTKTYTLNGTVPSTATLHWGVSPDLQIMSYPTTTSISVKCTSVSGWAGVYVWIDNSCGGDVTFHKDLTNSLSKTNNNINGATASDDKIIWHNPAEEISFDSRVINIYPNPTDDVWNVSFNGYKDVKDFSATVTDFNGRVVWGYTGGDFTDRLQINCDALAKGVYILKVNIDGVTSIHKLLK